MAKGKYPAGKELEQICRAFLDNPQRAVEDIQDELAEKWERRATETLDKIRAVVETTRKILDARTEPPIAQARQRHRDDLAQAAGALARNLTWLSKIYHLDTFDILVRASCYGGSIELSDLAKDELFGDYDRTDIIQLDPVDRLLAQCLLVHMRLEVNELEQVQDWLGLEETQIAPEVIRALKLAEARPTFQGTCDVCRGWI